MKLTDKQKADLRKHMEGHGGTVKEKASVRMHLIRRMATGMSLKKAVSNLGAKKFVDKNKGKPPSKMKNPIEPQTLVDAASVAYPTGAARIEAFSTRQAALRSANVNRGQVFEAARADNNQPPAFLNVSVRRGNENVVVSRERINRAINRINEVNMDRDAPLPPPPPQDPSGPLPPPPAGRGRGRGGRLRRMDATNRGGRGGRGGN